MKNSLLPVQEEKILELEHFPDPLCAFVFRNWGMIENKKLAEVVGATEFDIISLAFEMGLPAISVDSNWKKYGYLTIIRANWHLLDYEQICILLDWTEERLAYVIKEDDFFGVKLGGFKPGNKKLTWHEFDRSSLMHIQNVTKEFFAKLSRKTAEPFDFKPLFDSAASEPVDIKPDRMVRVAYPYCALYGDTFLSDLDYSFSDNILRAYASAGVNAVWCQAVLYKLAPFPFDETISERWKERLEQIKKLTERMAEFGIKLYLYLNEPRSMPESFFDVHPELKGDEGSGDACLCTSVPEVQKYLYESAAIVAGAVPLLGGFFTIVASENRTNCYSKAVNGQCNCPRCSKRKSSEVMAEVNQLIYRGAVSKNPNVRVIAWDWGMDRETALRFTETLPKEIAVMGVSEQGVEKVISGIKTEVIDYSISITGPGSFAKDVWKIARETGHPIFAKCQINNTWECSFVPFIPVFRHIYTHLANLRKEKIDGIFLSWTLGGFPSLSFRLMQPVFDEAEVPSLRSLYERIFSSEIVDTVENACELFSCAFDNFPFDLRVLYFAPHNFGPANLFYRKATGFQATMIGFPYDDLQNWAGGFTPEIFEKQFGLLAEKWKEGLKLLSTIPVSYVSGSFELAQLLDSAEAAYCHFKSAYNQIRFHRIRHNIFGQEEKNLMQDEADLCVRLANIQRRNPCIGYESSNHYFYNTMMLAEKYLNCFHFRTGGTQSNEQNYQSG